MKRRGKMDNSFFLFLFSLVIGQKVDTENFFRILIRADFAVAGVFFLSLFFCITRYISSGRISFRFPSKARMMKHSKLLEWACPMCV